MKVALADPPIIKERYNVYMPNLGILYLITYLRKNFDDLEIYYLEGFFDLKKHLKKLKEFELDIYGISFASYLADVAYKTMDMVRTEFPSLPIICGGAHPTSEPEDVLTNSEADVCVFGEGEETLTELVEYYMKDNKHLKDVLGIAYKESENVICTPPRPLIKNLDSIPFPAWDVVDIKNYPGPTRLRASPFRMIIVSRGCPYNCNFCSNPVWRTNKPWLRLRNPKNIAEEVEYLYNLGTREITLRCDEFNFVLNWSIEVCNEIKKLGHDDLYFDTTFRADKVTENLVKALKDINCWSVNMGIESGNQKTLDGINKKITLDQVVDACKMLKKYDIKILGFFMMFNIWEEDGKICYESPEDVMTTLSFARTLLSKKLIDFMSWGFVVPIPGAQLYDTCLRHNLIDKDKRSIWKWEEAPVKLPGIEEKTMQILKRKGMLLQARYGVINGFRNMNWRNWRHYLNKVRYIVSTLPHLHCK